MEEEKYYKDFNCKVITVINIDRKNDQIFIVDQNGEKHTIFKKDSSIAKKKDLVLAKINEDVIAYIIIEKDSEVKMTNIIRDDEILWKNNKSKYIILDEKESELFKKSKREEYKTVILSICAFMLAMVNLDKAYSTNYNLIIFISILIVMLTVYLIVKTPITDDYKGLYSIFKNMINQKLKTIAYMK